MSTPVASTQAGKMYETLRKTARRLEGELDVKLASFSRLCAGYESTSTTPDGIGSHQFATQTSQEITSLLQRLGEVNKSMEATITGNDNRQHTVARQRDILQDLTQEFKRLAMQVTQAQERADLLSGAKAGTAPLLGVSVQSNKGALLRERNNVQYGINAIDDVMRSAGAVGGELHQQRGLFDSFGTKLMNVGSKLPVVNGLLNAIRRKKSKDTIILTAVLVSCSLFLFMYWFRKWLF